MAEAQHKRYCSYKSGYSSVGSPQTAFLSKSLLGPYEPDWHRLTREHNALSHAALIVHDLASHQRRSNTVLGELYHGVGLTIVLGPREAVLRWVLRRITSKR